MYELTIRKDFSAAHLLQHYEGKCANLHGHTWLVEVTVSGTTLDRAGMLVDFGVLKKMLAGILQNYDHTCLNQAADFKQQNPTAENIARQVFRHMAAGLAGSELDVRVCQVRVWESPDAAATYREE